MLIVLWRIRSDHHYQPWARQIQPKVHASPGFRRDTVLLDLMCWFEPFVKLRAPKMFNLRRDPFERADENSNTYWDWVISHAYLLYGMQALVAQEIVEFQKFPPRQKPGSFNLDAVLRQIQDAAGSGHH